jgi:hypothetical protein
MSTLPGFSYRQGLFELANVMRPRVREQRPQRRGRKLDRAPGREPREQRAEKQPEIFTPLAQGRQLHDMAGEPGEEVGAKPSASDGALEITQRRCDHAHVDAHRSVVASGAPVSVRVLVCMATYESATGAPLGHPRGSGRAI